MQQKSTADRETSLSGGINPSEMSLMDHPGVITEIKKFATHDGPGIRSTVFLKGCPLRCEWCANPETQMLYLQLYYIAKRCKQYGECVNICPEGAISIDREHKVDRSKCTCCMKCVQECPHGAFRQVGMRTTVADVMKEIEKDMPFYGREGGITLSGGEPLFQPEFAVSLLKRCKERKISTVLDTCGFAPSDVVIEAMAHTDLALLDIKHMDTAQHKQATGVDNHLILQNAEIMARMTRVRISLPLIPGFNDSAFNLSETAKFVSCVGIDHVDINPFHILGSDKYICLGLDSPYKQIGTVKQHDLSRAKEIFEKFGIKVTVGRMM
jgi:pyruvate formate lyase activating enzyme